jgi:hypothetical protein
MNGKRFAVAVAGLAFLAAPLACLAQNKTNGSNEFSGSASYTDIEDVSQTVLELTYGRYLTRMHEVGITAGYIEFDLGDLGSIDGTSLGGFYHLNFPTSGSVTPYIGVMATKNGGDLGDAYDFSYGASAGIKVYPFEHGGFFLSVSYEELQGAEDFIPDANGTAVEAGLLLRF